MRPRLLIAFSLAAVIVLAQAIGSLVTGRSCAADRYGLPLRTRRTAGSAHGGFTDAARDTSRRTWGFAALRCLPPSGESVLLLARWVSTETYIACSLHQVPGTELLIFIVVGLVANVIGIAVLATARNANWRHACRVPGGAQ